GKEDLVRHEVVLVVIEVDEGGEQLLVGEFLAAEWKSLAAGDSPPSNVERVDQQPVALAIDAEHVLIHLLGDGDLLALQASLDRKYLIATPCRLLEAQVLTRRFHSLLQRLDQLAGLSLEEENHLLDALGVDLLGDRVDAGRRAAVDLVEDAGPPPVFQRVVGAGAQLEVAVDDPQSLANRAGGRIGTKVARAVLLEAAHALEARVAVFLVEPQANEILVVAKLDVEAGAVLFDQLVFQKQPFLLLPDHHPS